jgi:threonine 3-dehydrogenase
MSRSLVIGAGGQIGSDLVPALARRGDEVWMVDRLPPEETAAFTSLQAFFHGDDSWRKRWVVCNAAKGHEVPDLLKRTLPREVYLLTALLSATGEANPGLCWDVNMGSLRLVLETVATLPTIDRPVVLWPSSIAAFGPIPGMRGGLPNPTLDTTPTYPSTMYGVTKVAGELLGAWYAAKGMCDFRSVRYPGLLNATPPGGGTTDFANEMYFAACERRASADFLRADTRLPFMHMDDAVRALTLLAAADPSHLSRRVYNVAGLSPTAEDIAASITAEMARRDPSYKFAPAYKADHRQAFADSWPKVLDDAPARHDWRWSPIHSTLGTMTPALLDAIEARVAQSPPR